MGARLSKPDPQPEAPQLYAVATPHPTLQYIYPVYAAPMELPSTPERSNTKGRKSPLAWRNDKSKNRKEIQIVSEHDERIPTAAPVLAPNSIGTGLNEDGTWYHFHVDAAGAVDYIRPGTTLPTTFEQMYAPTTQDEGSIAPSTSMAGPAYEESYHSYPASPPYQGYHHPLPTRPPPSDGYSMVSHVYPQQYSPRHGQHYPYDPHSQAAYSHAYPHDHPRARSVSPVHTRSVTPSNMKPRRATTPTPRRSKTPTYDPAPPMPQHITPLPSTRRSATPFPKDRSRPMPSPRIPADEGDYIIDTRDREREREPKSVAFVSGSGRTSRTSRRPSADRTPTDEETAISEQDFGSTAVNKSTHSRPYSPTPASDASFSATVGTRERERERSSLKAARFYPSPSTPASQPGRVEVYT